MLQFFFFFITGVGTNPLLRIFSVRTLGIIGAVIFAIPNILAAFVSHVFELGIIFFLQGIGLGLIFTICNTNFNAYFVKRRATVCTYTIINHSISLSYSLLFLFHSQNFIHNPIYILFFFLDRSWAPVRRLSVLVALFIQSWLKRWWRLMGSEVHFFFPLVYTSSSKYFEKKKVFVHYNFKFIYFLILHLFKFV